MPIHLTGALKDAVDDIDKKAQLTDAERKYLSGGQKPKAENDRILSKDEPVKDEKKEEPKPEPVFCPRCGWDCKVAVGETISDEDKIRFRDAMLTGRRFTKDYDLLGGAIKLTLRNLTQTELKVCAAVGKEKFLKDSEEGLTDDWGDFYRDIHDCKFALSVSKIERHGDVYLAESEGPLKERIKKAVEVVLDGFFEDSPLRAAFRHTFAEFDSMVATMIVRAYDVNFWPTKEGGTT